MPHSPITVVHLVLSLETGGAERMLINLIRKMNSQFFKVIIVCLCSLGPLARLAEEMGASVIRPPLMIKGASLIYPYTLLAAIRRENPHILHSHSGCGPTAALVSRYLKVPQIHTEHGRPFPDPRWMIELERFYARATKKIVAVSPVLVKYLQQVFRWSDEKVLVIENGIDVEYFSPQPKPEGLLHEFGMQLNQKVIGSIGRLSQVKNYSTLLHAFREILCTHPQTRLLLVGEGPERKNLEDLASQLGISNACRLVGERFDIKDMLSCLDVFVLPSWSEGTSLSLLEAMACARPVVASSVGGNKRIVQQGETGFLVPPHDSQSFALHIQTLLFNSSMALRFGENSRKVVEKQYHLGLMAEKYERLYQEITFEFT